MNTFLNIPKWVSTRVYKNKNDEYRAYISNEKSHTYLFLENDAAKIWQYLTDSVSAKSEELLLEYARRYELQDEIYDFVAELKNQGLVSSDNENSLVVNKADNVNSEDEKIVEEFQESMYSWLFEHKYMYRLFIQLTYACNLKCVHCFNSKSNLETHITFEQIKPIIDECYEMGTFLVTLSGGECTISKDFLKIAKYVREKRLQLEFFTNGQRLYDDEMFFEEVVNLYPYKVALSLYSMNPEIHDSITGVKGSHHKTVSVIKKLIERNVHVAIKCFLTNLNADSYAEVTAFAKEIGASMELGCMFINNPSRNNTSIKTDDEQLYRIYSDVNSLQKVKRKNFEINEEFLNTNICRGGFFGLALEPNLNILICATMTNLVLGNAKKDSIKDIYNSIWVENSPINKFMSSKKKDLKGCYSKDYCKYCIYCPGVAMMNGKYFQQYEPFCREAKICMDAAEKN